LLIAWGSTRLSAVAARRRPGELASQGDGALAVTTHWLGHPLEELRDVAQWLLGLGGVEHLHEGHCSDEEPKWGVDDSQSDGNANAAEVSR